LSPDTGSLAVGELDPSPPQASHLDVSLSTRR
jgi:hypothetical protein